MATQYKGYATLVAALLSAFILTFCSAAPAYAKGKGSFISCKTLGTDVTLAASAIKRKLITEANTEDAYRELVWEQAVAALESEEPKAYIKVLVAACEKATS